MRHNVKGRHLSRTTAHREATRRAIVCALFTHEKITTTLPKAKEFAPFAEKLITLAKNAKPKVVGHLENSAESALNGSKNEFSDALSEAFGKAKLPLPKGGSVESSDEGWNVCDKYSRTRYTVKKEDGKLAIYEDQTVSKRRRAQSLLHNKAVVKKLFDEIAPRFEERAGGYTRIYKLPKRRVGDDATQAILELVERSSGSGSDAEDAE